MVPVGVNAGGSSARDSPVVCGRMPSSRSTTVISPARSWTGTPTTSSANRPEAQAAAARWWERAAQASWSCREICKAALTWSEDSPMCWPVNVDHSPSWIMVSTNSAGPIRRPQRAPGTT